MRRAPPQLVELMLYPFAAGLVVGCAWLVVLFGGRP